VYIHYGELARECQRFFYRKIEQIVDPEMVAGYLPE
jgi:hypothetical protein